MWKRFSYKVSEFDIFGEQVSLKLNGDQYFKTACGGFMTSVVMALCAVFFVIEFRSFVKLQNITVVQYQEFNAAPLLINLTSNKFMFAVSIEQTTAYNQNPFFSIVMNVYNQTRYDNGTVVKVSQTAPLVPCTLAHWENLGGTFNWTQSFYSLQLGSWLCPSLDSDIVLQGAFDSTFFDYVRFTVVPCNPKTTQNCASDSQRAAYLKANNAFSFQFYTSNFVINPDNIVPYDTYLLSMLYWDFIPNVTYVEANVFMQEYDITTDTSLMPWTNEETLNLPVLDSFEVQTFVYTPVIPSTVYAKIFLRRSYFSQIYQRQFQKFQDVVSYVGGFVQALIIFFGIFISAYNHKKLMIYLANKLYDFELDEQQDKERNEKFQSEIQNIQEHYQKNKSSNNLQQNMFDSHSLLQQNEVNSLNNYGNKSPYIEEKPSLSQNLEYNELYYNPPAKEQVDMLQSNQLNANKTIINGQKQSQLSNSIIQNQQNWNDSELDSSVRRIPEIEKMSAETRIYNQGNIDGEKAIEVQNKETQNIQPVAKIKINSRSIKLKTLSDDEQSSKKSDQPASNEQSQNIDEGQLQSPKDQQQSFLKKLSVGKSQVQTALKAINKQADTENVNQKEQKQKFTDWRTFLKHNIDQIILRRRQQLEMTFEYFVFVLTCGKLKRTNRNLMIDKSTERVEAQLDIYTILEKLQQFDKMQKLLLNQEQRVLFNFCPKEIIQPSDEHIILGRKKLRQLVIKGFKKGQDSDKKQPKKRMMSVIASSVNKFWQASQNSKNKISAETQDIVERGGATASYSTSEIIKQPEDQSMQFFVHLYQAYDKVSTKVKQQQESSVQDQGLSARQSILKDHLQSNLPQIVKETVQLDVNERLMGLLGKEMYQIMYTAQLLKDDPEIVSNSNF